MIELALVCDECRAVYASEDCEDRDITDCVDELIEDAKRNGWVVREYDDDSVSFICGDCVDRLLARKDKKKQSR